MGYNKIQEELINKYKLAGKIRFVCFSILLLFLWLMKLVGGYAYLNGLFITLIFVEALLNQPYDFIIKKVNIERFQYYQMMTDIIAISWIMHYMGGLEAPLVSIAFYAVILWAGVVSSIKAVTFAVVASSVLFSLIVIGEHTGVLPFVSFYEHKIPTPQMLSLLVGNVTFFFAFGYFSAWTSRVIKQLERKRQEETLKQTHKFLATGYLVSNAAHDILNSLASVKGYVEILLDRAEKGSVEDEMLQSIARLEDKSMDLLERFATFSQKPKPKYVQTNINETIENALSLTWPLVRYSKMEIERLLDKDLPEILADKNQLEEVFVALILNSLEAVSEQGKLTVKTSLSSNKDSVEIVISDTGEGIKTENIDKIADPFFSTKKSGEGLGLGLTIVYEIVRRHSGEINVESKEGLGTTFTIRLPFDEIKGIEL